MSSARTMRVLGAVTSAVFLLSFGPFNSVWKSRQVVWTVAVLAACAVAAVVTRARLAGSRERTDPLAAGVPDFGAALAVAFGVAVMVGGLAHSAAMARLPADEFVNVMGSTVAWWRAGNVYFTVLYLFLPVLYILNTMLVSPLGLRGLVAASVAPLVVSLGVLVCQVHVAPGFLAKWADKPYVTADGLATDPNAFAMLAYLFVAVLIGASATASNRMRAGFALLVAGLLYGIYQTSCRSALAATTLVMALVPALLAWSHRHWPWRRRLLAASLTVIVLAGAVSVVPLAATRTRGPMATTLDRFVASYDAMASAGVARWFEQFEYRHLSFSTGWRLFATSPWGGIGPGGYYREFPNVVFRDSGRLVSPGEYVDSALSHYLMIAGDFGAGVLLLNVALLIWPALLCARRARRADTPTARFEAGVLGTSLLIALPYVAAIPPSYFPDVIWAWTAIAGHAVAAARGAGELPSLARAGTRAAAVAVGLVIAIFVAGSVSYAWGDSGYAARLTARWWPAHLPYERGFHPEETLMGRRWRWTERTTTSRVRAESGTLAFDVVDESVRPADEGPVRLSIALDGVRVRDAVLRPHLVTTFEFPIAGGPGSWVVLHTEVDKTFNPKRAGVNEDTRDLGVLVSPLRFPGLPGEQGGR